ncbi:MAG TPA: nitroreductase/quinone reductase family protein, partial [Mycobacterium sp.]|nr:nitroreductase/quinone reductase family protein [Mycobacterium sp.]
MAYLKPPWFTRVIFNRVAMATGVGNSETLTVTRRVSGQPQQIPVVVPEVAGVKYLVSTRGETDWVRNVRADASVRVGDVSYVAAEVPVEQRAP